MQAHSITTVVACDHCRLRRAVWLVVMQSDRMEKGTRRLLCDQCYQKTQDYDQEVVRAK